MGKNTHMEFLTTPLPPHAYTVIGLGIVGFFILKGAFRGVFKELFGITCLIVAYPLAEPFGWALKPLISLDRFPPMMHGTLLLALGGTIAYGALEVLFLFTTRLLKLNRHRYGWDRFFVSLGGAVIGGLFGAVLVLILSWFLLTIGTLASALPMADASENEQSLTTQVLLFPATFMGAHNAAFRESALGKFAAKTNPTLHTLDVGVSLTTEILQKPENLKKIVTYPPIAEIIQQKGVQDLLLNEEIQAMMEKNDILGLMNHPATQKMLSDPKVQEALKKIDPEELKRLLED